MNDTNNQMIDRNYIIYVVLCICLGYLGVHKFFTKKTGMGFLYLFTLGIFGIGWIYDSVKGVITLINKKNRNIILRDKKNEIIDDSNDDDTKTNNELISSNKFSFFDDDNRYLRYAYYDVLVKGIEYRSFDISQIKIDHQLYFDFEETNENDPNAIKVLYDNIFIGYIPKNNLQEMLIAYSGGGNKQVCGFTTQVNQKDKIIKIGLGFYDTLKNPNLKIFECKLISGSKNEEYDEWQENLFLSKENSSVELDYDYENEQYTVTNDGAEIGRLKKKDSSKIFELEQLDFPDIKAGIISLLFDDESNYVCKIKVIAK